VAHPRGRLESCDLWYRWKQENPCGFDSEFLMSGRAKAPEDVHSIQFSFGTLETAVMLESADELKAWLHDHKYVKTIYGFVILPDLGSVEEWLGPTHVSYHQRGVQLIGHIKYGGADISVYDSRPLLQNFGLRRLEDCGQLVGAPKLPKPEWLGLRPWNSDLEHAQFVEYAKQDAIVTSLTVKWLKDHYGADPAVHTSAGTLARDQFSLPKRLVRRKQTVSLPPLERLVKSTCYAGRSEGFVTGFTPDVIYNDVTSLYPCSLVTTKALSQVGATQCDPRDLIIDQELNGKDYGWIEGVFETRSDLWGLPLRGANNFYATGVIQGFYHTFDLAAAKASVLRVAHAYKPVFSETPDAHRKYSDMLLRRLEGRMSSDEKMLAKAMLNSLTGKLGQSHPIAATSNFFAYSTVLAHSHLIMSRLFDRCPSQILAMDTDSIFSSSDMSGKHFELTDGEISIPLKMDVKGKGDLAFFRSKNYAMKTADGDFIYARHGWTYWLEDYLKLYGGDITELTTRKDIKHTLLVKEREALKMAKGRWRTKVMHLGLEKIKALLTADIKRKRADYDSYGLIMQHKNTPSEAWNYEEIMNTTSDVDLGFPIVNRA